MKKVLLFVFLTTVICNIQAQTLPKGTVSVSAGYGAGSLINAALKNFGNKLNYQPSTLGPLYLKGEYAVADNFTVGLDINYNRITATFNVDSLKYTGNLHYSSTNVMLRASYLIPFASDNGGFYFGGGIGYKGIRFSYSDDNPNTPVDGGFNIPLPFAVQATIGVKYFFTPNIGAYAELGATKSIIQAGITTRF